MANHRALQAEVRKLKNTQKTLGEALTVLFELLEKYSPVWYQKRCHDQAKTALTRVERLSSSRLEDPVRMADGAKGAREEGTDKVRQVQVPRNVVEMAKGGRRTK